MLRFEGRAGQVPRNKADRVRPHRSVARAVLSRLGSVVCFLVGLSSLGWVLNRGHPVPELEEISDKLEFYHRAHGAYSAVFFGSSKVYLGFDPQQFDAELAKRGVKMKTLNFGVDSMMIPESGYVCTHLLE